MDTNKYDISSGPYYDMYQKLEKNKQYTHMLAYPGRVAQAREFTQMQSMLKDIIKGVGDSIMKDGDIIEGCQVVVDTDAKKVTVTPGKVYINGMVLPLLEARTLDIKAVGTEVIGFLLKEELVTEVTDKDLRDPATGFDNGLQAGCHRIKSTVDIVLNNTHATTLTTLENGVIKVEKYAPTYDKMTMTLARRTHDESGSYIVNGLSVRVVNSIKDPSKYYDVIVDSGKAYVQGYELTLGSRRIQVDKIATNETRFLEDITFPVEYNKGDTEYTVVNPGIESISNLKAYILYTQSGISNTSSTVTLSHPYVRSIKKIIDGSDKEYSPGVDYRIIASNDQSTLEWLGGGNMPTAEYSVVYEYRKTFIEGEDYTVSYNRDSGAIDIKWTDKGVNILSPSLTPEAEGGYVANTLTTDYYLYLARKDIVYIDEYGDISVLKGIPASKDTEKAPSSPSRTISIATITVPPGSRVDHIDPEYKIKVSNVSLTRFTMRDIQDLINRVKTLEYDQTVLSLNNEAISQSTSRDMRGIFTDSLIDFSKISYGNGGFNKVHETLGAIKHDTTLDLINKLCYLPTISKTTLSMPYNNDSTITKYDRVVTIGKETENKILSQDKATRSFLVNPYTMFPGHPELSISPSNGSWVDLDIIEVSKSLTNSEIISTSTRNVEAYNYRGSRREDTVTSSYSDTPAGSRVETFNSDTIISEKTITYMRPQRITATGSNFGENRKDIRGYIDGVPLEFIIGTDSEGNEITSYTIDADVNGKFTAVFDLPERIPTGVKEVRFETSDERVDHLNSASALYQSVGILRTVESTTTTLTTLLYNRLYTITTTHNVDPLGQTFVLDRSTMLKGITLYFKKAPEAGSAPITCEIREVVNGNISSTLYSQKTLPADHILTSEDSRIGTRFVFDDPVLLEANTEYAFVVRSTSPRYELWVAELGEEDVLSRQSVTSNPYLIGVMMSSSNNSSWTTHQTMDIKFDLIEEIYKDKSEIIFNPISLYNEDDSIFDFSRVYLSAESLIPDNTAIDWSYRLNGESGWAPIYPYDIINLNKLHTSIELKATLSRNKNTTLSPMLLLDSVGLSLSKYDINEGGYYVSNIIEGLDEYNSIEVILDTHTPSTETEIEVFISPNKSNDVDFEMVKLEPTMSRDLIYGWKESTFVYTDTSKSYNNCRIFVKMSSNNAHSTPAFRRLRAIMSKHS